MRNNSISIAAYIFAVGIVVLWLVIAVAARSERRSGARWCSTTGSPSRPPATRPPGTGPRRTCSPGSSTAARPNPDPARGLTLPRREAAGWSHGLHHASASPSTPTPTRVWAALRDVGNAHHVFGPVLTDCRLEGDDTPRRDLRQRHGRARADRRRRRRRPPPRVHRARRPLHPPPRVVRGGRRARRELRSPG